MGRFADISQYTLEELDFWNSFTSLVGTTFCTSKRLTFTFEVRGNEVFIDRRRKSLTRSTVVHAFRTAQMLKASGHIVTGPKQLGVFGASYLFPVLKHMDIV